MVNTIGNKRGWIRVFEAVLAILLVTSVVLVLYSRQTTNKDPAPYFSDMGSRVLTDISYNDSLRAAVFSGDNKSLSDFAASKIPSNLGFEIKICALNVSISCGMSQVIRSDVYASEKIFSSDIINYNPKRVKIFLWEK